jgi:hypothetical protein
MIGTRAAPKPRSSLAPIPVPMFLNPGLAHVGGQPLGQLVYAQWYAIVEPDHLWKASSVGSTPAWRATNSTAFTAAHVAIVRANHNILAPRGVAFRTARSASNRPPPNWHPRRRRLQLAAPGASARPPRSQRTLVHPPGPRHHGRSTGRKWPARSGSNHVRRNSGCKAGRSKVSYR